MSHHSNHPTITLASELISYPSVSPKDCGVQEVIAKRLEKLGFHIDSLKVDGIKSLWARFGHKGPLFVFAGHTDVVPSGDLDSWTSPPFEPEIRDGRLYGRGAADMKGAVAAFVTSIESFLSTHSEELPFSIGVLIAGDEEYDPIHGTLDVLNHLEQHGQKIDYCIVGEPSSVDTFGDMIKIGRRGSLHGILQIRGIQGHVAYQHRAKNAITEALVPLAELSAIEWDSGSELFPPTNLELTNIKGGTGVHNVIPGVLDVRFNLRFSNLLTPEDIQKRCIELFDRHKLDYKIEWQLPAKPFLTKPGLLSEIVVESIREQLKIDPELSTSGGTSDARFIAPTGAEVLELGVTNETIHKVNENALVKDLVALSSLYENILCRFADNL